MSAKQVLLLRKLSPPVQQAGLSIHLALTGIKQPRGWEGLKLRGYCNKVVLYLPGSVHFGLVAFSNFPPFPQ